MTDLKCPYDKCGFVTRTGKPIKNIKLKCPICKTILHEPRIFEKKQVIEENKIVEKDVVVKTVKAKKGKNK